MGKEKVLFVGAFKQYAKAGATGGVIFASRSLVNSKLKDKIDWILLDTTGESVPPPSIMKRGLNAANRIFKLLSKLFFVREFNTVLIFCGDGWSFWEKGTMVILSKWFGKKVIIAPRSGLILKDFESIIFRKFASYVFLKSDIILCQSSKWKTVFTKLISDNSLHQWNGVDHLVVRQNWIDIDFYIQNRPTYDAKRGKIVFLYLGWVVLYKGIKDLIDAIEIVKDKLNSNVEFLIAGNGSDFEYIKRLAQDLNIEQIVSFAGWVDQQEKMKLLQNVDAYILPSHFEGFPNSLLEAMASGIPCIATRVGAVEDVIKNNYNGILVDAMQPVQIADAILKISQDSQFRSNLGSNARKSVVANNSITSALTTFEDILL